jgi:hypothetical protein
MLRAKEVPGMEVSAEKSNIGATIIALMPRTQHQGARAGSSSSHFELPLPLHLVVLDY